MTKIIVITGYSKITGIGYNTAMLLAKSGHQVIATVRNKDSLTKLNSEHNGNPAFDYLDLANEESISTLINNLISKYGRIDTLINNAGYGLIGAIEQLSIEQIRNALDVNIVGTINLIQHVIPFMKKQSEGHIINVSSIHSTRYCQPARAGYRGSKAFLEVVSEALSLELAHWNIHVSLFEPGRLTTPITKEFGNKNTQDNYNQMLNQRSLEWFKNSTPPPQSGNEVATYLAQLVQMNKPPFHFQTGASTI